MLLSRKYEVKLTKPYLKILYLSVAANNTFVFLAMYDVGKDVLVHCSSSGQILHEYHFSGIVDTMGMLSDKEVIVLQPHSNKIKTFKLSQSHGMEQFDHQFLDESSERSYLDTFSENRYVCVREQGNYSDHRLKLSYYQWPLKKGDKPFAIYESQDDQWTHEYITTKGNNHSMIIWYKARHDEEFEFRMFDLRNDLNGKYNVIKIKNTIGQPYHLNKVECAVDNIWQIKKNQYCLACISNKTESKAVNSEGLVNNNFILDMDHQTIRQTKFCFDPKYNDYQIDIMNLGFCSMFRTFDFLEGRIARSPIYYVNNQSEQIIQIDSWQCTYRTRYFIPSLDYFLFVESEFQNGNVDSFTVYTKVINPKYIALHFLLHLNQDFDDSLLKDVVEMLEA